MRRFTGLRQMRVDARSTSGPANRPRGAIHGPKDEQPFEKSSPKVAARGETHGSGFAPGGLFFASANVNADHTLGNDRIVSFAPSIFRAIGSPCSWV
jgi:hypothetical protein